jgi:MYXO-CTERM domain-containing protein
MLAFAVAFAGLAGPPQQGGDPCLQAIALDPSAGQGAAEVFRATYRHCEGAASFRVVQLYVGDEVLANAPSVNLGYEAGRFFLEDAAGDCAPGDASMLVSTHGTLDCATSSVTTMGNDIVVEWSIAFDTVGFAGIHGVFFDAKGGAGDPEPRLEWTDMGTFVVAPDAATSGAASTTGVDSSGDASGGDVDTATTSADTDTGEASTGPGGIPVTAGYGGSPADTGCSCGADPPARALGLLGWIAIAARRRRQPPCDST